MLSIDDTFNFRSPVATAAVAMVFVEIAGAPVTIRWWRCTELVRTVVPLRRSPFPCPSEPYTAGTRRRRRAVPRAREALPSNWPVALARLRGHGAQRQCPGCECTGCT